MPELVFLRRGEEVLRFALDGRRVVLGRGEKSDVVIPDPEVSRLQAAVLFQDGGVQVEDLSGRGTVVSGTKTQRAALSDGGDIALGQWRAVFREAVAGPEDAATEVSGTLTEAQESSAGKPREGAQVRVRQGAHESLHRLPAQGFTVGKDAGNDLVLEDRFASGRHLRIAARNGAFFVSDQASTNGTWFGPVRLFEAEVPLQTTLRVGETELSIEPSTGTGRAAACFQGIIGEDPSIRQVIDLVERVAPSGATVTILGESGTGKELVAQALHTRSQRAGRPFVPVNCAAISKELIESELFGHEKGAFTGALAPRKGAFEEADGGTLFLDEIGELPVELQAKLLRALESGEIKRVGASRPSHVDVRVVAATNKDLLAACRNGEFREDLYYRLCVVPLHLPPLRSRRMDISALVEHFLKLFSPRGQTVRISPAALERLKAHGWPGNIRELRNVVHRALLLRRGPTVEVTDLTFDREAAAQNALPLPEFPSEMTLEEMLRRLERQIVEGALRRLGNNRERVARELGVARSTLFKRLKDWGLTKQDDAPEPSEQGGA